MPKKLMTKTLQPCPTEDDGEIFADISYGKWWDCMLYSNNNNIILFCTHIFWVRYLEASYGEDSIESESSVALLLSNSIYKAHPPKNITASKIFLLLRKKEMRVHLLFRSENMLRHLLQKWLYYQKSLATVFYLW